MNIKLLVEHICCDLDRGFLEDFAKPFTKKDVRKINRTDLENIYYAVKVLQLRSNCHYQVILKDDISETIVAKNYNANEVLQYILRKTLFWWADEPEYPLTREVNKRRVIVREIKEER